MARAICVYCSSSDHVDRAYFAAAARLGEAIGRRGDTLIWGGGKVGLMGELARAVHAGGGRVVGVIPRSMTDTELAYRDADELIVTDTMRQRKQIMDERADAFVVLPGGFGTLEELSEMLTQKILGYTDRPLVLVNIDGFYTPLLELFAHFIEHRFAQPKHMEMLRVVGSVDVVYDAIDVALQRR
jgi:uncharacterized protein (TIGR00730 family)